MRRRRLDPETRALVDELVAHYPLSKPDEISVEAFEQLLWAAKCGVQSAYEQVLGIGVQFAMTIAAKHARRWGTDPEDNAQEAMLALSKAIASYHDGIQTSFFHYANVILWRELDSASKARGGRGRGDEPDETHDVDSSASIDVVAVLDASTTSEDDPTFDVVAARYLSPLVRRRASRLPEQHRLVISLRYGLEGEAPLTQSEVASLLGITPSRVSQIESKAIVKLSGDVPAAKPVDERQRPKVPPKLPARAISYDDAAAILGVAPATVRTYARQGLIASWPGIEGVSKKSVWEYHASRLQAKRQRAARKASEPTRRSAQHSQVDVATAQPVAADLSEAPDDPAEYWAWAKQMELGGIDDAAA